jgi:hypothetical protein
VFDLLFLLGIDEDMPARHKLFLHLEHKGTEVFPVLEMCVASYDID